MKVHALFLLVALAILPCAAQGQETASSPESVARKLLQEIAAGQFDKVEAQYDAKMSAGLPAGRLAAAWGGLLGKAGSFDSIVSANASKVQTLDVVVLVCKFQKGLIDTQIALGMDGKIAGIYFGGHREPEPPWAPPAYAKPDSFTEQPLTLVNGKFEMPGTLTLPKGAGPFAAVVLLQG